ncbi:MAG: ROK family protein [Cyclonatronaceae bacterium]
MLAIGIDLGGTTIKGALAHREKGLLDQLSIDTEADKGLQHTLGRIAETIKLTAKRAGGADIAGVGIGAPGVISFDRKSVSNPPNLTGWTQVHLAREITERTGYPALLENDANLMALGSARYGIGKNYNSFIMLTLGTGVGGGIIYNNELFRGTTGGAGELGHVIIDYNGPESNSVTRGGIEAYLGQRFLSHHAAVILREHPENDLYKQFSGDFSTLEPVHLSQAARNGNELASSILGWAGKKLGYAIVNYIHILDIRTVILSGGVARAGSLLIEPAKKAALSRLMPPFHPGFNIIYEDLGNDAAMLGAASLAFDGFDN